jgi:hypothetical protein
VCMIEDQWVLYAVTPGFEVQDCEMWVELVGVGTYPYWGVSPPVWAYS